MKPQRGGGKPYLNVLGETGGSHSEAPKILGITRITLYNKARDYGRGVERIDNVSLVSLQVTKVSQVFGLAW